jgi:hypothetical protein
MLEDAHLRYGNTFVWSLQDESAGNAIRKVNYIREYQIGHGVPKAQAYNVIMFVMAALFGDRVLLQFCSSERCIHGSTCRAKKPEQYVLTQRARRQIKKYHGKRTSAGY